jgi:hypothetical protein
MKKVFLAILVLSSLAKTTNAQKGSILLYGNLGITSTKDEAGDKTSNFAIMPGVGYQFNDKWTAGLNIGVGSTSTTPNGGSSTTTTSFNVGPFLRYTKPLSNIFSVYGQLDLGFTSTSFPSPEPSASGFAASVWPAISINVNNGLALNFAFGAISYSSTSTTVSGTSFSSNSFGISFGSGASFGVSKNFGGSSKK